MTGSHQSTAARSKSNWPSRGGHGAIAAVITFTQPALAQTLSLPDAAQLAVKSAPSVDPRTLLAFAWHESKLRPWAIHDNTTGRSAFPASAAEASALAAALLARGHNIDAGIMQVNSANFARTRLTAASAVDPGESMRAGALILSAAYLRCLRASDTPDGAGQQAALRCAASVYNTGGEQAGISNGYQPRLWMSAAQIVPAIQPAGVATIPPPTEITMDDAVAPRPRRPPPGLEDALHAGPPQLETSGPLADALRRSTQNDKDMP